MAKNDPYNKGQVDEAAIAEEKPTDGEQTQATGTTITEQGGEAGAQADYNFAEDKSKNYPSSTPTTGQAQQVTTPEAGQGGQAIATQTTGQEQQQPSTPSADPSGNTFTESQMVERFGSNPATGNTETTQSTGQGEVVTTPSNHPYDWGNKPLSVVISENPDKPLQDIISDYREWSRENGNVVDYLEVMEAIKGKDPSKSAAQNAADEKKRLRKEKFDQLGNFLLHVGNAIGNMAGGGMGAVKLEDPIKFTERQRMLKEKADEQRNRYNDSLLAQMTKQDADLRNAEMAKKRLEEQAAYRKAMADAAAKKANSSSQVNEAKIKWYNAKTGQIEELTPEQIKEIQSRIERNQKQGQASLIKANNSGGGSGGSKGSGGKSGKGSNTDLVNVSERYDRKGNLKGVTRTYKEKKGEKKSTGIKNWVSRNKKQ